MDKILLPVVSHQLFRVFWMYMLKFPPDLLIALIWPVTFCLVIFPIQLCLFRLRKISDSAFISGLQWQWFVFPFFSCSSSKCFAVFRIPHTTTHFNWFPYSRSQILLSTFLNEVKYECLNKWIAYINIRHCEYIC